MIRTVDDLIQSVRYSGPTSPWRQTSETEASEDEPLDSLLTEVVDRGLETTL